MRTRLWLAVGAAAAIVGVTGLSAYADLLQELIGILPGGPTALLPAAAITSNTDPVPPGAQKQPLYASGPFEATCAGGTTVMNGQFGFAVLNTSGFANSKVKAEIVIKDGIPNVTYEIYLHQNPGDCPTLRSGTIVTDNQGNGNGEVVKVRAPGSTRFWATGFVDDFAYFPSNPKSLLRTVSVALD
ncbi:MAG TPA: hypothetical protein VEU09_09280 [Candidatus Binatia bacterium]|nr:hypothetical protein [Candidatus Binatia bacterium]